jgi:hypothetical protein
VRAALQAWFPDGGDAEADGRQLLPSTRTSLLQASAPGADGGEDATATLVACYPLDTSSAAGSLMDVLLVNAEFVLAWWVLLLKARGGGGGGGAGVQPRVLRGLLELCLRVFPGNPLFLSLYTTGEEQAQVGVPPAPVCCIALFCASIAAGAVPALLVAPRSAWPTPGCAVSSFSSPPRPQSLMHHVGVFSAHSAVVALVPRVRLRPPRAAAITFHLPVCVRVPATAVPCHAVPRRAFCSWAHRPPSAVDRCWMASFAAHTAPPTCAWRRRWRRCVAPPSGATAAGRAAAGLPSPGPGGCLKACWAGGRRAAWPSCGACTCGSSWRAATRRGRRRFFCGR